MNGGSDTKYRFGEFEARLEGEILLRNGVSLPIQKLPFRMLVLLLERPGGVVSRETLRGRLWGDQTHLQFENGLHVVAAKLRETLGEQASSPTYIKTIARSGYQFIGEVSVVEDVPALPAQSPPTAVEAGAASTVAQQATILRRTLLHRWFAAIAFTAVLLAASFFYKRTHRTGFDVAQQKLLIGYIANETGDAQLDGILNLPLQLKLRESHYLNLVADDVSRRSAGLMAQKEADAQLVSCRNLKADFLVSGSIANHAGYRLTLTVRRCRDGKLLLSQSGDVPTPLALLSVLDESTAALRQRAGEPAEMVQQANAPITQATTNSLAALRAFSMGDAKQSPATADEAISYYKLAVDLDPQFALAYSRLGLVYAWRGYDLLSRQAYQSAFDFRNRTTDRERLFITSHYYGKVTGELPRAIQTYKLWASMFPYDAEPKNSLAVIYNNETSQPMEALREATAAVALSPDDAAYNVALAEARFNAGDFSYLNARCRDGRYAARNAPSFLEICYLSYFVQNDEAGMLQETAKSQTSLASVLLMDHAAWGAASRGSLAESLRLFQQARESAIKNLRPDWAAEIQGEQALVEATLGLHVQARQDALSAAHIDSLNAETKGIAALALATTNDTASAQAMMKDASQQAPLDTLLDASILGSTRAVLALNTLDANAAVDALSHSRPYDFSVIMDLAPAYYRGLAYEKNHNWEAARIEFQSLLDHRVYMPDSLFIVLATMEMAHSLAKLGDHARANKLFTELEIHWAHADRGFLPVLELERYKSKI